MTSLPDPPLLSCGTEAGRLPLPPDIPPEPLVGLVRLLGRAAARELGHAITDSPA